MDAGESKDIVWTYRWEVQPVPPGTATWLVDDGGRMEPTNPIFFAFQVREAAVRAPASIPRFSQGSQRDVRFGEPTEHFKELNSGERMLASQEVYAFLPAAVATSERTPWLRVGEHVFFLEEEAREVARARREGEGAMAAAASAVPAIAGPPDGKAD